MIPHQSFTVSVSATIAMTGKYGTERKTSYHCGKTRHFPNQCQIKNAYCHACGKEGHIAPVCKSAHTRKSYLTQVRKKSGRQKSQIEYKVHKVARYSNDSVYVHMLINREKLSMELDTGAEVSIICGFPTLEGSPKVIGYPRSKCQMVFQGKNHSMTDFALVPNSFEWCVLA